MSICPLCNGLKELKMVCPECQNVIKDNGKATDYFDDYSAYMDIDIMKLFDGLPQSLEKHQCVHFIYCSNCGYEQYYIVKE
ncbi:hypothetical protein [Aeribacillus alveayuensis]|uniref:Broad-specificity NMP kinase n=1 Tax=Aeribacillus alveayuensis TaxID=279215 RepID=A0ABT9VPQ6_9BACI|nr:broad-specificity NMP kinase [Bacillus alveayuensis]